MEASRLRRQFEVNTFSPSGIYTKSYTFAAKWQSYQYKLYGKFWNFPVCRTVLCFKRALDILFNSMSLEMYNGPKFISVKPGVIATPLWEKSIELNKSALEDDAEYAKEMKFMEANARKNSTNGLPVERVASIIKEIAESKKPKSSYTIGFDAFCAELISKLPQDIVNRIIKLGMKKSLVKIFFEINVVAQNIHDFCKFRNSECFISEFVA